MSWLASSSISVLEKVWLGAYSGHSKQFCGLHSTISWSFDAFGSGSYASKRVGFSGPTMVLSETQGLQL